MSDYLDILTTFLIEGINAWATVGLIVCGIYLALDLIARGLVNIAVRAERNAITRDARRNLHLVTDPATNTAPVTAAHIEVHIEAQRYQHAG